MDAYTNNQYRDARGNEIDFLAEDNDTFTIATVRWEGRKCIEASVTIPKSEAFDIVEAVLVAAGVTTGDFIKWANREDTA
ncbi:hypothetical protein [Nocardiopsis synnemataformans]|uniref:hypothetical protein n=1 Tax=Nocardiopsis synnemataformans TaxID=61305 RepID=UPI003EBAE66F